MNRPLLISLILLAALTSAATVYLFTENNRLRAQLAARGTGSEERAVAYRTPQSDGASAQKTGSESASVDAPHDPSEADAADNTPPEDWRARRGEERRDRGREAMARMLTDPAMREVMLTRMKNQVDRQFGGLFVRLGLNEDQAEVLRTLLAERQMVRMQSGFLSRNSDEQGGLEADQWAQQELATLEAGIEAVLGADGLDMLREYQSSSGERQVVANISQRASYLGAPLDAAASDRLVNIIRETAEEHPLPRYPGASRRGEEAVPLTRDAANDYLGELQARNQAVLAAAGKFLSDPQLEALAAEQLEEYEQQAAQLDFQLRNPDLNTRGGFWGGPRGVGPGGRRGGDRD